jgi:hypothetical protein
MRSSVALLALATLALGCDGWPVRKSSAGEAASSAPSPTGPAPSGGPAGSATVASVAEGVPPAKSDPSANPTDLDAAAKTCAARRKAALEQPALPGLPAYEEQRVSFARVRGRAMLWRRPLGEPSTALTEALASRRKRAPIVDAIRKLDRTLDTPAERRETYLRQGYLFAEDPEVALALVEQLQLAKLFDEPTIHLRRGVDTYALERQAKSRWYPERYLYRDGPFTGMPAELLHGDRVATSREALDEGGSPAVDLRELADRSTFDRLRPVHLSEKHLVADLRFGSSPAIWVPALFELDGAKATLACEELTAELAQARAPYLEERALLDAAMGRLRAVVRAMVREEIPFDSARDQTNGFLRRDWRTAYLQGKTEFESGGRSYSVYTTEGRAKPPQVCIDFLTDVLERATGTWYEPAQVATSDGGRSRLVPAPKLLEGGLSFDRMKIRNRRSVVQFERFAKRNDELLDVWQPSKKERVKFEDRRAFFDFMRERADQFRVGDMLIIHGVKDGGRPHDHSLLVTETDPITGVVTLIASNAVKPREQTLEGIMHISPDRTLRTRIRVKRPWLELIQEAAEEPL